MSYMITDHFYFNYYDENLTNNLFKTNETLFIVISSQKENYKYFNYGYIGLEYDDKKGVPIQNPLGGKHQITIINESGLYALILSSKLPQAKDFKRWVASEVLGRSQTAKAIREHVDEKDKGGSIITTPL